MTSRKAAGEGARGAAQGTAQGTAAKSAPKSAIERIALAYGDLLFDLSTSILWSQVNAQIAVHDIFKEAGKEVAAGKNYVEFERPWLLRIAFGRLKDLAARHGRKLNPSEQIMLDAALPASQRLSQFESYFHRLQMDDQFLLLLKDKYGIPYVEISAAMGLPEGSLKIKRAQAIRSLEEWLWDLK